MNLSIKISQKTATLIKAHYPNHIPPPNFAFFAAKTEKCTIIIYNSLKAVFSGENAQIEANKWREHNFLEVIGSDEVGKGDLFGPLVVCACYIDKQGYEKLSQLNIDDSKKFNDEKIRKIAPKIIEVASFKIKYYSNKKLNELYAKNPNLNKLVSLLHFEAVSELYHQFPVKIIIDGYTTTKKFFEYTQTSKSNLELIPKAEEQYFNVAAASIIARYFFITYIEKMEDNIHKNFNFKTTIPLGAGTNVDEFAIQLFKKVGVQYANYYTKVFFKNFKKIGEILE